MIPELSATVGELATHRLSSGTWFVAGVVPGRRCARRHGHPARNGAPAAQVLSRASTGAKVSRSPSVRQKSGAPPSATPLRTIERGGVRRVRCAASGEPLQHRAPSMHASPPSASRVAVHRLGPSSSRCRRHARTPRGGTMDCDSTLAPPARVVHPVEAGATEWSVAGAHALPPRAQSVERVASAPPSRAAGGEKPERQRFARGAEVPQPESCLPTPAGACGRRSHRGMRGHRDVGGRGPRRLGGTDPGEAMNSRVQRHTVACATPGGRIARRCEA